MDDAWGVSWGGAWGSSWVAEGAGPEYSDLRVRIAGDYWIFDEDALEPDIALDHRNFD